MIMAGMANHVMAVNQSTVRLHKMAGGPILNTDAVGVRYGAAERIIETIIYLSDRGHTCREVAVHLNVHVKTARRLVDSVGRLTPLCEAGHRNNATVYKVDNNWLRRYV